MGSVSEQRVESYAKKERERHSLIDRERSSGVVVVIREYHVVVSTHIQKHDLSFREQPVVLVPRVHRPFLPCFLLTHQKYPQKNASSLLVIKMSRSSNGVPPMLLPAVAFVSTTCAVLVSQRERIAAAPKAVMRISSNTFKKIFPFAFPNVIDTTNKRTPPVPGKPPPKPNDDDVNDDCGDDHHQQKKAAASSSVENTTTTTTTAQQRYSMSSEERNYQRKNPKHQAKRTLSKAEKMVLEREREEALAWRANENGFEMVTIRASSREEAKRREQAKRTDPVKGVEKKKTRGGKRNKKGRKRRGGGDATSESEEEEEEEEKEEDVRIEVDISTFGAAIVALRVPNKLGDDEDVVLGFDSVDEYARVDDHPYFGAVVGRVANRIKHGKYALDGVEYTCDRNDGDKHTLHGGLEGLDVKRWTLKNLSESHVELSVLSGDLEQNGFPGNCWISVVYRVRIIERAKIRERKKKSILEAPSCELYVEKYASLTCEFKATADSKTPICLAQHSYFNLSGCDSNEDVGHHLAEFPNVSKYLVLDDENIPTGEIRECHEAFDFSEKRLVFATLPPMCTPLGFDHNFCIDGDNFSRSVNSRPKSHFVVEDATYSPHANTPTTRFDESLTHCASFESTSSGRTMDVYTDAPGFQFYTGNFLDGTTRGKNNIMYDAHAGFCVETQWWPNAVNEKDFPDSVLEVGQTYVHNTCYEFGLNKTKKLYV